jgi:uncharacterized protein
VNLPLHLMRYQQDVAFARLPTGQEPAWDWRTGPLSSITYTDSETSIVCAFESVPEGVRTQGPLTAYEIAGPLDFSMVGVLSGLLEPLAKQRISILALSTFDTDWILVDASRSDEATTIWKRSGFTVAPARLSGNAS